MDSCEASLELEAKDMGVDDCRAGPWPVCLLNCSADYRTATRANAPHV